MRNWLKTPGQTGGPTGLRKLLRLDPLSRLWFFRELDIGYSRQTEADPVPAILEAALGESPQQAQKLARDWYKNRKLVKEFWHECANASMSKSLERANRIILQDQDLLQNFLNSSTQGIVLLTIHMGDYIHAILKILSLATKRKVLLFRKKAWSKAEQSVFRKINSLGHNTITVPHGPSSAKTLASALRLGAIIVLPYDLSSRWGETEQVRLFNTDLLWVSGPFFLSMLGRSTVIPFFTFKSGDQWHCEIHPARNYVATRQDRASFLISEMQSMGSLAETYIRTYVSQWNHWHLIPEMAQVPPAMPDE